jgi:hypothetical protein
MPRKRREIRSKLTTKFGFSPSRNRSDDHEWFELHLDGLPVIATKLSHSAREVSRAIESKIARQLCVRVPYYEEMMKCSYSAENYYTQIRNDPFPPWHIHL